MGKEREFDNVLDECLGRLLVMGETVEQCLQSFPEHTEELKPLLEMALATKQASAIQPRPEFRDKARYEFHSALQGMETKKGRLVFDWRSLWAAQPLWATTVAIILVFLLAGSGTVMAAGGSMPDEPLYPVKLATEQARLVLTPSALGKAELYAKLADKRVLEIIRMAAEGKPEQIERTARRLDIHLAKIADLASAQKATGGIAMAPVAELASEPTLAPREAPAVEEAPAPEVMLAEEAPAVKKAPTPEPALTAEEAPVLPERARDAKKARIGVGHQGKLKAMIVSQSNNNTARLRALLETVPESARPALLRAIVVSETGYKKAIESLD
ncbi:DUF5667 domain-containing protein [Chloroflexota bacterium]